MANFVVSLNKDPGMTSIEKLAGRLRSAALMCVKLKMFFKIAKAMTHTANIEPTKTHRTHISGSQTNEREIKRPRQAMVHVGGEKRDGFRCAAPILRLAAIALGLWYSSARANPTTTFSTIPFVSCKNGIGEGPTGKPINVELPVSIASRLSFYSGAFMAVLAPRGWHCSAVYGSSHNNLYVYPYAKYISGGPIVAEWSFPLDYGEGQAMLPIFGKYFPQIIGPSGAINYQKTNDEPLITILANDRSLAEKLSKDRVTYLSYSLLEYSTLPNQTGLGSLIITNAISSLTQDHVSNLPTLGMIDVNTVDGDGLMTQFAVRLPKNLEYLETGIVNFTQKCFNNAQKSICFSSSTYAGIQN